MEYNEKQFIKGFNHGYVLAEYESQLLNVLLKGLQTINSYTSGISYGQKEYELKQTKNHLNELEHLRQKNIVEKETDQI